MNEKQELIASLVADEVCPFDAEYLENAEVEQLEQLAALMVTNDDAGDAGAEDIDAAADDIEPEPADQIDVAGDISGEIAALRDEFRGIKESLEPVLANQQSQRIDWIGQIVQNSDFEEAELDGLTDAQIEKLATTVRPQAVANYGLRSAPQEQSDSEWEPYEMPVLNGEDGE